MHAQAKQEADTVPSVAADANAMPNGDTPAAPAPPDTLGQADMAANCIAAAPREAAAEASEAPVKVTHLMPDFAQVIPSAVWQLSCKAHLAVLRWQALCL